MVAREDQDVFRIREVDEVQVLVDGICGAAIPVCTLFTCIRRQDEYAAFFLVEIPGAARSQVVVEFERAVLRQHADLVDAGVGAVTEWKVNDAVFPTDGTAGFAIFFVKAPRRLPCPPASIIAKHSVFLIQNPPWISSAKTVSPYINCRLADHATSKHGTLSVYIFYQ